MSEKQAVEVGNTANLVAMPSPIEDELLNWDARIEKPPPARRSGTIRVKLQRKGRSIPIPIADPEK